MTVKELKEFIKDLPDDMLIMVADSEWGTEEASDSRIEKHQKYSSRGDRLEPVDVLVFS